MKTALMPLTKAPVTPSEAPPERRNRPTPTAPLISPVCPGQQRDFYAALSSGGSLTGYEIAIWTGTDETLVREWLAQQATSGILSIENPRAKAALRRFRLESRPAKMLADV